MFASKISVLLLLGFALQNVLVARATPDDCGCVPYGCGPIRCCVPPPPITPPISFAPIPQPIPIKVPNPPAQSVTIPNIILALLPPTSKPPAVKPCPPPFPRPQPIVFPLPQPYPVTVPDCGCAR